MKKIVLSLIVLTLLMGTLTSCGKKENKDSNPVKDELLTFINVEIPEIQSKRDEAIAIYNDNINKDDFNPDEFLSKLEQDAVPLLTDYINELNNIDVKTEEVKELKKLFVDSSNKQLEAMNFVVTALKEKDTNSLTKASSCLNESTTILVEYESKLEVMAIDLGIEIHGDINTKTQ